MKNVLNLIVLFIATLSLSCQGQSGFVKIDESEIDTVKLKSVQKLATDMLLAQKRGIYYQLTSEQATAAMIEGLSETVQKSSHIQLKQLFGAFKEIKFHSLMENEQRFRVYRFKGVYESDADVEVRAVTDSAGKLAGFFIKPWNNNL